MDVIIHYRQQGIEMHQAVVRVDSGATVLPNFFAPHQDAAGRFLEFLIANIRNPNTLKAYTRAAAEFAFWCEANEFYELAETELLHVATYIEMLQTWLGAPSVK
jgi:hypothetical protein